jgi:hypothetical protein
VIDSYRDGERMRSACDALNAVRVNVAKGFAEVSASNCISRILVEHCRSNDICQAALHTRDAHVRIAILHVHNNCWASYVATSPAKWILLVSKEGVAEEFTKDLPNAERCVALAGTWEPQRIEPLCWEFFLREVEPLLTSDGDTADSIECLRNGARYLGGLVEPLSQLIHELENRIAPLNCDRETLQRCQPSELATLLKDVLQAAMGSGDSKKEGYLVGKRNRYDLLQFVKRVLFASSQMDGRAHSFSVLELMERYPHVAYSSQQRHAVAVPRRSEIYHWGPLNAHSAAEREVVKDYAMRKCGELDLFLKELHKSAMAEDMNVQECEAATAYLEGIGVWLEGLSGYLRCLRERVGSLGT